MWEVDTNDSPQVVDLAVSSWISGAVASLESHEVQLKQLPGSEVFLDADLPMARRYALAALVQLRVLDEQAALIRTKAKTEIERMNPHLLPGWNGMWARRLLAEALFSALMRRALPLDKEDLAAILDWCGAIENISSYVAPVGSIVKALTRFAAQAVIDARLGEAIASFAKQLRASHHKDANRFGTVVEQLSANQSAVSTSTAEPLARQSAPSAAAAGNPLVLRQLKDWLGVTSPDANAVMFQIGPDSFYQRADCPLKAEHDLLSRLFIEVVGTPNYMNPRLESGAGHGLASSDARTTGRILLAAAERHVAALLAPLELGEPAVWQSRYAAAGIMGPLASLKFEFTREQLFDFLLYFSTRPVHQQGTVATVLPALLSQVDKERTAGAPLTEGERYVLYLLRTSLIAGPPLGAPSGNVARLTSIIGDAADFYLVPGEAWTEQLNAGLSRLDETRRRSWIALLKHLLTATSARPSAKWLKTAIQLVDVIGAEDVRTAFAQWAPLVSRGQTTRKLPNYGGDIRGSAGVMHEENATCLRGLLWLAPALPDSKNLVRVVTDVALSAYKKVPGVGPRAVKVGNAAVYALSQIQSPEAAGQLAILKVRVRFGTAQKEIEKAFNAVAEALQLPRDQIEEMSVPAYGLDGAGRRREVFLNGEYIADMRVDGHDVNIAWSRSDGKPQKSIPAKVKSEYKEDLKELQTDANDIAAMLPVQAERIDSMFLLRKQWPLLLWRERYLDHPLVGTVARRLIWNFRHSDRETAGVWREDRLLDIDDKALVLPAETQVELWHPIGRPLYDILSWRAKLEDHQIRQPFKQAHREVYLLTDAERQTATYSNRFAAHVLRQHQFNALCAARGWKNKLRMMVDDTYPPASRELPAWGLRVEFWIEGIGTEYGIDTNDSGAFLRISTDQVRFYRSGAPANYSHAGGGGYSPVASRPRDLDEPLDLEHVPALVFSEIMRDVDLFVGVASVGNDPAWQDGGPDGRHRDYWSAYSFGDLAESAKTRRTVIERLLPRLKIAERCWLGDRFLIVRGDLRTYKIHLGSGNILMEPNDQYLCIVPSRSAAGIDSEKLFLPFEGDSTLSIILSKAFLLAADTKITDPTIRRQIDSIL